MINTTGGYYIIPSTGVGGSATILWSSGGTVTTVPAGSSYSLSAVTILNYSGGTVYSNVEQGQIRVLSPAIVQGASGNTVAELAPDGVYVLDSSAVVNVFVQNSDGSFSTGYTENGTFIFPDSTGNTYNTFGELLTGFTIPAGVSAQTIIGDSLIENTDGSYSILVPATSGHTIPNSLVVNEIGQLLTTVRATETYTVPTINLEDELGNNIGEILAGFTTWTIDSSEISNSASELLSSLPATSGFTVGDSLIDNTAAQTLISLPATSGFTVGDSLIENTAAQTLISLPATSGFTVGDSLIENTDGSYSILVPATSGHTVPDGNLLNSTGGTVFLSPFDIGLKAGVNNQIGNYRLFNSEDALIRTAPIPTDKFFYIDNFDIINTDGQSATSVVYSGTVHVDFSGATAEGITYHRPQFQGQITSYAIGDVAWHFSSGTYDYPRTGGTIQELDHSASSPFYTLKYDNAFGNKFRYTTDQGEPASDQKAGFRLESYSASTLYYVIDNLTGIGWLTDAISYNQNWSDAILSANTFSWSGFSETYDDWRMPCVAEIESVINMRGSFHLAENIFERFGRIPNAGSVVINMYLSDTSYSNSGNAYLYNDSAETGKRSKTSPSFHGLFPVRNHY